VSVDIEPLRESAHKAVIQIHLHEGNRIEAIRQFRLYRNLLQHELGIEPSDEILQLVNHNGQSGAHQQPWAANGSRPTSQRST
jgi:DNA-binding SARP family transcriptional activator